MNQYSEKSAALQELIDRLPADLPLPPLPPLAPAEGQTDKDWLAAVARVRAQHDILALEGNRLSGYDNRERVAVGSVTFHQIPVPGDGDGVTVTARAYRPEGPGPFPAVMVLHGGAWWLGGGAVNFDANDIMCRTTCVEAGVIVLNVDHRLAPEYPWPHQTDDVLAALAWMAADPDGLGIAGDRLAVLGMSSGGNLAASAVLQTHLAGGPQVRVQVLQAAPLDLTGGSESLALDPLFAVLAPIVRDIYLQGRVEPGDPRVSPLLAEDLAGMPPTALFVGTEDALRDDSRRYAARLREAGVPVELHEFAMAHSIAPEEVVDAVFALTAKTLRQYLHD
jgi:acetyl esterase